MALRNMIEAGTSSGLGGSDVCVCQRPSGVLQCEETFPNGIEGSKDDGEYGKRCSFTGQKRRVF